MRIDSGQQLDIVYTTENLLVVTPVGDQTSVVIIISKMMMSCLVLNITTLYLSCMKVCIVKLVRYVV